MQKIEIHLEAISVHSREFPFSTSAFAKPEVDVEAECLCHQALYQQFLYLHPLYTLRAQTLQHLIIYISISLKAIIYFVIS